MAGKLELSGKERRDVHVGRNIAKAVLVLFLVLLVVMLLRETLRGPIESACMWIVDEWGYMGIFFSVLFIDTVTVPASPDIMIFVTVTGEMDIVPALVAMTTASIIGGQFGYFIGRWLGDTAIVKRILAPYRSRGHYLAERYGLWAVVIAAMTPVPFSTVCWLAGIFDMKYSHFVVGTLWRIPRFILWYMIIRIGWV